MHFSFLTMGSWEGNENFLRCRELGRELIERGFDVSYIVNDFPFHHTSLRLHPKAKVAFVSPTSGVGELSARRRVIDELKPDVVHILNPSVKAMLAVIGRPKLKVIGDWDMWHARREMPLARGTLERYADRWHRRRSDLVVVGAKYLQDEFRKLGTESVYIPYATYLQKHPETTSPFDAPTAVYMGILYPNYDYSVIFDAAMILKRRGVEPRITFVGKGPELEKWRQFVRENDLKFVKLIGYQPEDVMWQHLRHARVNLFPIRPSLSNLCRCPAKTYAYAEARRPIITSRVGEVPPVLGENAVYVDQSAEAFADALQALLDEKADVADVDYDLAAQSWSR